MTQHLAYADDVIVSGRTLTAVAGALEEFLRAAREVGLEVNVDKTVYMKTATSNDAHEEEVVHMGELSFARTEEFKYLGSKLTESNSITADIKARIAAGSRCFFGLQRVLKYRRLSRNAKLLVYKSILRPTVTYGSEAWTLTSECVRMLRVWERKVLRRIYGPVRMGERWRIRSNQELQDLYGEKDIVAHIKIGRLRWLGHVERMEPMRLPRKFLYDRPGGGRRRGRPRLRWLDDVEKDLRDLGIGHWKGFAADRGEWKKLITEAMVLHGL